MSEIKFPKNFLWGASTSAHQVEGSNFNDWTIWEKKNTTRLVKEAKQNWQKWQQDRFPEMFQKENYISGRACDHYNRFEEDFDIAKSLNHNAHRFSIEWSRIEPEEGKFNQQEIEHYKKVIRALRARHIEPFVTLWHWTMPVWFADKGGFEKKKNIKYFTRYAERVISELNNEVKFWNTLNEPVFYSSASYLAGIWPPQKKNFIKYWRVLLNLSKSHNRVYKIIHNKFSDIRIGVVKNNIYFEGNILSKIADCVWNKYFLNKIKNHQDFIGLNYYFHNRVKGFKFNQNDNKKISDMGWEIYPEGIYYVLKLLKKYDKPIYITENGLADADDTKREQFIIEHLKWIHKAIQDGVDVKGYFYWSLLDNFEWDKGFWPRFGLVEIDYSPNGVTNKTLKRTIRQSAYKYAEICRNNGF